MQIKDIKLQLEFLFQDLASNCNDEWVSKGQCKQEAYEAYEKALELFDETLEKAEKWDNLPKDIQKCFQ